MNEPLGYSRDGEFVTLRMSVDDYEMLLLGLGYVAGGATTEDGTNLFWRWIALANRINVGNAEFVPYEIPEGEGR